MRLLCFFQCGIFCLLFCFPLSGNCQKIEIEKRVGQEDFPVKALEFIEVQFPAAKKIKWYKEWSKDSITYEAKFNIGRQLHSVEFYRNGTLMDIEKEIDFSDIPAPARDLMQIQWDKDFKRHKVMRTQEQKSDMGIRYEIIVRGRDKKNTDDYEYLFEGDGSFIDRDRIIQRADDVNLY